MICFCFFFSGWGVRRGALAENEERIKDTRWVLFLEKQRKLARTWCQFSISFCFDGLKTERREKDNENPHGKSLLFFCFFVDFTAPQNLELQSHQ